MMSEFRIGHGYDVHRLVSERKLFIGGVEIPHTLGLLGHSDADVLLHAICDALLGAMGLGDIGKHFPDNDDAFKDISSVILLERCRDIMTEKGYTVGNVDATVIAQKPKLAPYVPEMVSRIAAALNTDTDRINVKATTEEKLGFTGSEQGIAAHAVALIQKLAV